MVGKTAVTRERKAGGSEQNVYNINCFLSSGIFSYVFLSNTLLAFVSEKKCYLKRQ
jgi:hypothetical protein